MHRLRKLQVSFWIPVRGPVSKKKLGVFATDAPLLGSGGMGIMGFNMGGGSPAWEVISELRKQYDVQEVTGQLLPEHHIVYEVLK